MTLSWRRLAALVALVLGGCSSSGETPPRDAAPAPTTPRATTRAETGTRRFRADVVERLIREAEAAPIPETGANGPVSASRPDWRRDLAALRAARASSDSIPEAGVPRVRRPLPASPVPSLLAAEDVKMIQDVFHLGEEYEASDRLLRLGAKLLERFENRRALGCFEWALALTPGWKETLEPWRETAATSAIGRALVSGDLDFARRWTPTLAERSRAYFTGRLAEERGDTAEASRAYAQVLERSVPDLESRPLCLRRDLARRRALGESFDSHTAGVDRAWTAHDTPHFTVLDDAGVDAARAETLLESAWLAANQRLGLTWHEPALGRIAVHVFKNADDFHRASPYPWSAGCAKSLGGYGPETWTVCFEASAFTPDNMQHELGHVLAHEVWPQFDLSAWANEGVACFAENDAWRDLRRRQAGALLERDEWVDLVLFLRHKGYDISRIAGFYSEAAAVFEALVARTGSVAAALQLAQDASRGVELVGGDLDAFELDLKSELRRAARPPDSGWAQRGQPGASATGLGVALATTPSRTSPEPAPARGLFVPMALLVACALIAVIVAVAREIQWRARQAPRGASIIPLGDYARTGTRRSTRRD